MNKNQKGIAHLFLLIVVIFVAIGAIGYLAYQNAQLRKQTEETTSTPVSEDSTDDRCYWEFRTITPVGTPTKWTGWYNDMNTVPNKCKPITLSTGTLAYPLKVRKDVKRHA